MADEMIQSLIDQLKKKFSQADLSDFPEKYALQVNLVGRGNKPAGVFYVEVLNGVLSIEPYEYIDRDAAITLSKTTLLKIFSGKKRDIYTILKEENIAIEGDSEKLLLLQNFL